MRSLSHYCLLLAIKLMVPNNPSRLSPLPYLSIHPQLLYHYSSLSKPSALPPPSDSDTDTLRKLYHKDWLSPKELLNIFTSVPPTSVLRLLTHVSTRKDFNPTEAFYSLVFHKLGESRDFDAIAAILSQLKAQRRTFRLSDDFFYNVIRIYGNVGGRINWAIDTLFDMPAWGCWPSTKTFNFVLNLLVSTKQFDIIHEVYLGAGKLGVEIDACCLNILIKGLCENGTLEGAFKVLDEFPKQGYRPNERTYATLMRGLCENGRVDDAFRLLEKVDEEGISPDTIMFNVLISGLRKQGRVEDAMRVLDRMRLKGCEPNSGSYQQVLYGLIEAKRSNDAKEVLSTMINRGWRPSFVSFKMLFMAFCEEESLENAHWVLNQMVRHGFVPRMGMWRGILAKLVVLEIKSLDRLLPVSPSDYIRLKPEHFFFRKLRLDCGDH